MIPETTEVLIVGAGPTGLTLANALAAAGIDHVVIDRLEAGRNSSRAAVIHAHTLDVLDRLGLASALVEAGLKITRFGVRDRDRHLLDVHFDRLPTRHPYLLMLPQNDTERLLARALLRRGGMIHRGVEAQRIIAHAKGAAVEVAVQGLRRTVYAKHVVGADGMHSLVRESAGIGYVGGERPEAFVLADVEMNWPLGDDEVSLFFSPAGLAVVAPMPQRRYRIVATMAAAVEAPGLEDLQAILDARGPSRAAIVRRVVWSSRFHIHHRLAQSYRAGPLLLMGDAAHVHSPAGGQGMNTGLVDAVLLGEALAAAKRDGDRMLDRYSELRKPAAAEVLRLAKRMTQMAVMRAPGLRIVRNLALRCANAIPAVTHALAMDLSGLGRSRASELGGSTTRVSQQCCAQALE